MQPAAMKRPEKMKRLEKIEAQNAGLVCRNMHFSV
jgi:hypothetical protein